MGKTRRNYPFYYPKDKGISAGNKLDDLVINVAPKMLQKQFPNLAGFQLTLLHSKKQQPARRSKEQIQIIHSRGDHWLLASTLFSASDSVQMYDSAYTANLILQPRM